MRTIRLLPAALAILASAASARADLSVDPNTPVSTTTTTSSTTTAAASPEDARTAALEQRFAQGKSVEAQGQLQQALGIFDGIIADAPDAKGSLREAGLISVQLGDYVKADGYFSRLHALVPEYPMAIEMLIQVNQALKHDAKVEILLKQFKDLYAAGKLDPKHPYFVRECIPLNSGAQIRITQFFDYHQRPNIAWIADYIGPKNNLKRQLAVNYDPEVTATMRQDPKLANAEQFLIVDNVTNAQGAFVRVDCYQQFLALPDYGKLRTILLEIFANALKPVDSAPVPQNNSPAAPAPSQ
jgi:tetratricopeptide (TPR) repeat protein